MSLPDQNSFAVVVPSNVIYPGSENTPWDFEVPLSAPLNFKDRQEWKVALTSIIVPPLNVGVQSQTLFVYSELVLGSWVGSTEVPLLTMVDATHMSAGNRTNHAVHEPEHPMYLPLRSGYIDKVWVLIRDEKGDLLQVNRNSVVTVTLHFRRTGTKKMEEQYLVLPSNDAISKEAYPDNGANTFTTRLPGRLDYNPDEWEAALTFLSYPAPPQTKQTKKTYTVGVGDIIGNTLTHVMWQINLPKTEYNDVSNLLDDMNGKWQECLLHITKDIATKGGYISSKYNKVYYMQMYQDKYGITSELTEYQKEIPVGHYSFFGLLEKLNEMAPRDSGHPLIELGYVIRGNEVYLKKTMYAFEVHGGLNGTYKWYEYKDVPGGVMSRFNWDGGDGALFQMDSDGKHLWRRITSRKNVKLGGFPDIRTWREEQKIKMSFAFEGTYNGSHNPPTPTTKTILLSEDLAWLTGMKDNNSFVKAPGSSLYMMNSKKSTTVTDPKDKLTTLIPYHIATGEEVSIGQYVLESGLYVYSDLVNYTYVGNTSVPLMGVIPLLGDSSDGRRSYEFKNPIYIPLRLSSFNEITIYVRDRRSHHAFDNNDLLVVGIHIRKR